MHHGPYTTEATMRPTSLFIGILWLTWVMLSGAQAAYGTSVNAVHPTSNAVHPTSNVAHAVSIVTTTLPVYAIVQAVAGPLAKLVVLHPKHYCAHHAHFTPQDVVALHDADLLVYTDPVLDQAVVALGSTPRMVRTTLQQVILGDIPELVRYPQRPFTPDGMGGDHHHDHDPSHHHGPTPNPSAFDPHLWWHPHNAIRIAHHLAAHLALRDPNHGADYHANARRFEQAVHEAHQQIGTRLAPYQQQHFMVWHDQMRYFEEAFRLQPPGALVLEPEDPLTPVQLERFVNQAHTTHARCMLTDASMPHPTREMLATRTGLPILTLPAYPVPSPHKELADVPPDLPSDTPLAEASFLYVRLLYDMGQVFRQCLEAATPAASAQQPR